jgi:glycosyltransferase involved in cell wall biosynthesis
MEGRQLVNIVTPVFNDWQSFGLLVKKIDEVFYSYSAKNYSVAVIAVNDGSTSDDGISESNYSACRSIESVLIIHLTRNFGHQSAIAIGVCYLADQCPDLPLIVMDSDGEDKPEDIVALLDAAERAPGKIIFAERAKRSESFSFRFFYALYKRLYRVLTGAPISFGNFSLIPASLLRKVSAVSEIWIHYAAGLMKSRIPWTVMPTERGKRLAGRSKMNFVALLLHGLSGIAVHLEIVAARMLVWSLVFLCFSVAGIGVVFALRFLTDLVISGWASGITIGLIGILMQALFFSTLLVFLVLNNRMQRFFAPRLNYAHYIQETETVYARER